MQINISESIADSILIEILKEDYLMVRDEPAWNDVDKKYNKKLLKGIQRVLHFHMTDEEWKDWEYELDRTAKP